MINIEVVEGILNIALAQGARFADLYAESKSSTSIVAENHEIEIINTGTVSGTGIRILAGEAAGFASIDSLEARELKSAAETARAVVNSPAIQKAVCFQENRGIRPDRRTTESASINQKTDLVRKASEAGWARDRRIRQVSVGYVDQTKKVLVADSKGNWAEDEFSATRLTVSVVAADGPAVQTGHEGPGRLQGFEFFKQIDPTEVAILAADRALKMLEAKAAPTGEMPVVLEEGYGGVLLHEACGHGLEADLVIKESSVFGDRIGTKVASSEVTAIDDPTIESWWGSYSFDDEGVPARRNVLIEDGILCKYIQSRETARKTGAEPTGNGRRQSFRHLPIPRMSNTFIAPGKSSVDEMIASVKRGLYAKALGGGQVNTANGDFVFGVSEGYMIENGKIGRPVKGATLIGNGLQVLLDVAAVGVRLVAKPGFCGKDGQSVPVTTGQPAILVSRMTVGGTAL